MVHIPVLTKEVMEYLDPKPNENFVDGTLGYGGHTTAILERTGPKGMVLGIEADKELSKILPVSKRLILVNDSYANLKDIVAKEKFKKVSGILLDVGMSSWHLDQSGRGFSFQKNEPLDMRYDLSNPLTAKKILNFWSENEISNILREYGQEDFADKISKEIIRERKFREIATTHQLVEIIKRVVPPRYLHAKISPATRSFQALRIAVNDELNNLKKVLPAAIEILTSGGRIVVISFHSLEDKIVKDFFKEEAKKNSIQILTKKPITPSFGEIKNNARARSAKLRAAIKI